MVVKFSRKGGSDCSSRSNGRRRRRSNKVLEDLPVEIIFDIFSRLSAVTLIRLTSVCKFWNNLTRDPGFIDLRLKKKMKLMHDDDIPLPSHDLILGSCRDIDDIKRDTKMRSRRSLILIDGVEEGNCKAREIRIEHSQKNWLFRLVGSCNGLVCLEPAPPKRGQVRAIIIYNPITGESWCLPKLKPSDFSDFFWSARVPIMGFGFDHATGKYKVIRFLYDNKGQLLSQIITLGEKSSWRKLLDIPVIKGGRYGQNFNTLPMFLNGFLYWIITKHVDGDVISRSNNDTTINKEFILAFDVGSEKFQIINFPAPLLSEVTRRSYYGLHLINIKGS
ncbi:F-box/kelch-repeat protein At3g06240-like [Telopea speciosissima]|uniref:F-box/kelch-repeat protein At3g06240-like n=1 Tax=Telopea speciosissima TaxID=54955 RepID=UPI001CC78603|nr:F-box/kelch-repeat protein At3g06240-like [Telopea speciosissima]